MLIEFRVQNYRSLRESQELTLVASKGRELEQATFSPAPIAPIKLLRGAVLYGANASGKSNLLRAITVMRELVLGSATRVQEGEALPVTAFRLAAETLAQPTRLEIVFLYEGVRYQYGFAVDGQRVQEEWLTAYPKGSPQRWFHRALQEDETTWTFGSHLKGEKKGLTEMTRANSLLVSVGAQFKNPQLGLVFAWFRDKLRILGGGDKAGAFTANRSRQDSAFHAHVVTLLKAADTGITDMQIRETPLAESKRLPKALLERMSPELQGAPSLEVQLLHRVSESAAAVPFAFDEESDGTQRHFQMAGPCVDALLDGKVLIVDELNTNLHPHLSRSLVELFQSPEHNPRGAQLIFTTHDTTLLDPSLFRRDQVWFTEKDSGGATRLYALSDFHPRKDEPLQRGYLAGRYGAIPFPGDLRFVEIP